MQVKGFTVAVSDKAVGFVRESDVGKDNLKPLWVPLSKIVNRKECDESTKVLTVAVGSQSRERNGIPEILDIADDFCQKLGIK